MVRRCADLGALAFDESDGAGAEAGDWLGYEQFLDVNIFSLVARRSEGKAQKIRIDAPRRFPTPRMILRLLYGARKMSASQEGNS